MLNVKYYKDLNHNYLIIKNEIKEKEQSYQYKMLTGNKIRYLLDCKIRYINEECHFYYEISSKQNLNNIFDRKTIGYEQLYHLFDRIGEAVKELGGFLLDSRYLLLSPEYIYAEPETEEYFFLYYPYYTEEADRKESIMSLAEYLVGKADHSREETVAVIYKIYELAQDDKFILPEIINLFDSSLLEENREESEWTQSAEEEIPAWEESHMPDIYEEEESKCEEEQHTNNLSAAGVLAFLSMMAAAGIFCIGYFYTLSEKEKILSAAGISILIILSAFLFLYLIFNITRRKNKGSEKTMEVKLSMPPMREEEYMASSVPYKVKPIKRTKETAGIDKKEEEYGNTVFLESSVLKKENKLYGTNKGNKYHIDLNNLPCTIGKMAGSVDVVIKDSTVSRIHARFTRHEEEIYVTDMNSTNGTFKNGLRLDPNETVMIEQGDELRFGRMTFCYR